MLNFPLINPVLLSIGPLHIRWYGLMYVFGFAACWFLGSSRCRKTGTKLSSGSAAPFTVDQYQDVLIWGIFGLIVGARLGYVFFYKPLDYLRHPLEIFALWQGGMSFHGGLVGVMLAIWLCGRKYHSSFLQTMDFAVPLAPPGLLFGRIGNFINAELWGRHTSLPWGMVFPTREAGPLPRHPSQLYEAALEGLVLFIVLWIFSSRQRPRGAVCGLFALLYGLFRFGVEFVREPDRHLGFIFGGFLTMGMLLCLPLIAVGGLLLWRAYRRP
jgi:phosphatidylglycerol:prolipoprotein diacylglycerol transferase